jgi:hypothetical protein
VILATSQFARLADALARNDFQQAAEARAELSRLGYTVRVRVGPVPASIGTPHLKPFKPRREAAGREVGHDA